MQTNTPTELLSLSNAASASPELTYDPVWISTDRRITDPNQTTMKFSQVGGPTADDKIGETYGPIFMVEFVDLDNVTATHIRVWGIDNEGTNDGIIYPVTYLTSNPKLRIYLSKFEFTNSSGTPVVAGGSYLIVGHRSRNYPAIF